MQKCLPLAPPLCTVREDRPEKGTAAANEQKSAANAWRRIEGRGEGRAFEHVACTNGGLQFGAGFTNYCLLILCYEVRTVLGTIEH
jgi:hypothetical protein